MILFVGNFITKVLSFTTEKRIHRVSYFGWVRYDPITLSDRRDFRGLRSLVYQLVNGFPGFLDVAFV